MVDEAKWKTYERIRAELETAVGDCEVLYDHKVIGEESGIERQIDIWLSRTIGDAHEVTVAIECKCFETDPVGIKDVDALYGFLQDVGANKAVLFSNTGFTAGATARADGKHVTLREFSPDQEEASLDWEQFLDVELDSCDVDGCWGMINWQPFLLEDASDEGIARYRAGLCERCSTFHIDCPNCGVFGVLDERDDVVCDGCGTTWELDLDRKGAGVSGIRLADAAADDDE